MFNNYINSYDKEILIRYFSLILFTLLFVNDIFVDFMSFILTNLSHLILNLFFEIELINNFTLLVNNSNYFEVVRECVAPSAYLFLSTIFLTIPIKLNKLFNILIKSIILFSIFNLFRIIILIIVFIVYGQEIFDNLHLLFYQVLSGIFVGFMIVYYLRKNNIKNKFPLIEDVKYIVKRFRS